MTTQFAYLANIRLPTEKAHGLQIVQMCEAFGKLPDVALTLYPAHRINTPELRGQNPFTYYGVSENFRVRYVPSLDLHALSAGRFELIAFTLQTLTYVVAVCAMMLFRRYDLYYSRDPLTLIALSLFKPRAKLIYEAHQVYKTGRSSRLQAWCCQRVGVVVAITGALGERMKERGARKVLIAHDGFRAERFASMPSQQAARQRLGLPEKAFIVGYAGRLHTMGMSKGVDHLIEAIRLVGDPEWVFYLVGGPHDWVDRYREQWVKSGLPPENWIATGTVPADHIPLHLAAFDVCTMPLPWTDHFAYYTSSLKLFEYMVSDRVILATDLPCTAEVIHHNQSAILAKPDDPAALAEGLRRLSGDGELRIRLAAQARKDVAQYEWETRARLILAAIRT